MTQGTRAGGSSGSMKKVSGLTRRPAALPRTPRETIVPGPLAPGEPMISLHRSPTRRFLSNLAKR